MDTQVFFNPQCSKCLSVRGILEEHGLEAEYVHYLQQTPTRDDLEKVLKMLGFDEPRKMMRTEEPVYRELHFATASRDELFDAMVAHPIY